MLAVVKTPRTDLRLEGDISPGLLTALAEEYGDDIRIYNDDDAIPVEEMAWFKAAKSRLSPGKVLRIRRENAGLTQAALGVMAAVNPQNISAMERGERRIGRAMARRLAAALDADPSDFADNR